MIRLATCSLCGCIGCHMSFLDMDEKLFDLVEKVEFDRSPFTDIKSVGKCDIGLIEGGLCNEENVEVVKAFRENCGILVAVGACAINGGIPSMRNHFPLEACLAEAYLDGIGIDHPQIPSDPELPRLLDKVMPVHEAVKIDYFLPGCPPPAEAFEVLLEALLKGEEPQLPTNLIHYD